MEKPTGSTRDLGKIGAELLFDGTRNALAQSVICLVYNRYNQDIVELVDGLASTEIISKDVYNELKRKGSADSSDIVKMKYKSCQIGLFYENACYSCHKADFVNFVVVTCYIFFSKISTADEFNENKEELLFAYEELLESWRSQKLTLSCRGSTFRIEKNIVGKKRLYKIQNSKWTEIKEPIFDGFNISWKNLPKNLNLLKFTGTIRSVQANRKEHITAVKIMNYGKLVFFGLTKNLARQICQYFH